MSTIFELHDVHYAYVNNRSAISDINLTVEKGEIFTIIGSNGSGKSTLMQLMGGLLFPDKGSILFDGGEITESRLREQAFNLQFRTHIGYVFQNPDSQLFCPTVLDELLFAPLQAGIDEPTALARAEEIMEMLRISSLHDRPTYMLSGGEKKRVAIGSVLTVNPEVLLLDEPVSGLDPKTRSFLVELIFRLNEAGKTIVITTHNLELADHFQSRVGVLSEEHKIERIGEADEILKDIDFLVKMNLISDQIHRHGDTLHKHIPSGITHKHAASSNGGTH
jgi:cobalt/nickel transport system ATP-binding protein